MTKFNKQSLENLEKLCRIKCDKEQEKELLESLMRILDYIEQLKEIDTKDIRPCNHVLQDMQYNVMRKDEPTKTTSADLFLTNAPTTIGKMIKVPPILTSKE